MFEGYTMVQAGGQPIDLAGNLRSANPYYRTGGKNAGWDLLVGYGDGKNRPDRAIPQAGDFNGNGARRRRFHDLGPIPGQTGAGGRFVGDLNHDGTVNNLDLRIFADLWLAEHGADKSYGVPRSRSTPRGPVESRVAFDGATTGRIDGITVVIVLFWGSPLVFWRRVRMKRLVSLSIVLLAGSVFSAAALANTGVINLGPEEILKAKGQEIVVPGYSVPSFEDWNNDHRKDLIIGEGGGGVNGKIRVYLNVGTEADPCFADYFYVKLYESYDLTIPSDGCLGCFPRLVDWDQDLGMDLLVGCSDGTVKIFTNFGTVNASVFTGGVDLITGSAFTLDVGSRATPSLVDWNNDGMTDVIAGGLDGAIHVYYNCGCGGYIPPRFNTSPVEGVFVPANGRDLIVPSGRSSPTVIDADGDGKKDLITGNTDGQILYYRNVGTDYFPMFEGYTMVQSGGQPIDLAGSLRSRPFVCYWNGGKDKRWDLLVGYGDGKSPPLSRHRGSG